MNRQTCFALALSLALFACTEQTTHSDDLVLRGQWLLEFNGEVMSDPQTSGLKLWRGKLLTVSDASAIATQRKQLHIIDPAKAQLAERSMPIHLSERVQQSCFAGYLNDAPDLEALAVDPNDDRVFVVVTEDATRGTGMSEECHQRYRNSGSTDFPSVLIRLELQQDNNLLMTHVRPLQFDLAFNLGNFPNDGIEGLAYGLDNTLYLGMEKDSNDKARIFSVQVTPGFWDTDDFVAVKDEQLLLPEFSAGNHPINGMDYLAVKNHKGFLIAAARNDDQLWIIDLQRQSPTKIIPLQFMAPTGVDNAECEPWELMDNASLEGVAIVGDTIWMINDPWRKNYLRNVKCETNRAKYEVMAPLLFSLKVDPIWIKL